MWAIDFERANVSSFHPAHSATIMSNQKFKKSELRLTTNSPRNRLNQTARDCHESLAKTIRGRVSSRIDPETGPPCARDRRTDRPSASGTMLWVTQARRCCGVHCSHETFKVARTTDPRRCGATKTVSYHIRFLCDHLHGCVRHSDKSFLSGDLGHVECHSEAIPTIEGLSPRGRVLPANRVVETSVRTGRG
ncbi:hypothetical protein BDV95DRAFT_191708 [Massariosphaeria phaeospora]|uniref:Uncharacterized protein n=1 Tax=Massariosphaeria phaeospora TaxID=100035 RepID=A0A7C8M6A5_9PLEO|nr:hypothetical protein BDV95DRAFT_191708 [Massariosphaeria phaeospora]